MFSPVCPLAVPSLTLLCWRLVLYSSCRCLLLPSFSLCVCVLHLHQVTLGITTLLTYVPVSLGAAHQAGALALFTGVLTLVHSLRAASPSAAALTVSRAAPPLAVLATAAIAAAVTQME